MDRPPAAAQGPVRRVPLPDIQRRPACTGRGRGSPVPSASRSIAAVSSAAVRADMYAPRFAASITPGPPPVTIRRPAWVSRQPEARRQPVRRRSAQLGVATHDADDRRRAVYRDPRRCQVDQPVVDAAVVQPLRERLPDVRQRAAVLDEVVGRQSCRTCRRSRRSANPSDEAVRRVERVRAGRVRQRRRSPARPRRRAGSGRTRRRARRTGSRRTACR